MALSEDCTVTNNRIPLHLRSEALYYYEIRADVNLGTPASIEKFVICDFWGTLTTSEEITLPDGWRMLTEQEQKDITSALAIKIKEVRTK